MLAAHSHFGGAVPTALVLLVLLLLCPERFKKFAVRFVDRVLWLETVEKLPLSECASHTSSSTQVLYSVKLILGALLILVGFLTFQVVYAKPIDRVNPTKANFALLCHAHAPFAPGCHTSTVVDLAQSAQPVPQLLGTGALVVSSFLQFEQCGRRLQVPVHGALNGDATAPAEDCRADACQHEWQSWKIRLCRRQESQLKPHSSITSVFVKASLALNCCCLRASFPVDRHSFGLN